MTSRVEDCLQESGVQEGLSLVKTNFITSWTKFIEFFFFSNGPSFAYSIQPFFQSSYSCYGYFKFSLIRLGNDDFLFPFTTSDKCYGVLTFFGTSGGTILYCYAKSWNNIFAAWSNAFMFKKYPDENL